MELICRAVEKVVSTGVDGTILILPMLFLIWALIGQAKDCVRVIGKILREESKAERINQKAGRTS